MPTSPSPRIAGVGSLARYTPLRKLGSGSVGTVYLALDKVSGMPVALKLLRGDRMGPTALGRLQAEFRAIASLHHDRIAAAHDFGYTEGARLPYYTRQYIPGAPVAPGPPAGERPAAFLQPILDLLDALEYLHAHGILHLDIHPGNLIVHEDASRGAILIDFGLVHSAEASTAVTGWGAWSPLPPELRPGGTPGPATDVFLAGRLLLYRLTGKVGAEPSLPSEVPGWGTRITLELERIVARALSEDPRERFSTASAMRRALAGAIAEPDGARAVDSAQALATRQAGPTRREPRDVLVGRAKELARIEEALSAVLDGKGAAVLLTGPPGAGKTRLLREARLRAQLRGLEVVVVQCVRAGGPGTTLREQIHAYGRGRREAFAWLEPLHEAHGGTPEERAGRAVQAYFADQGPALVLCVDDFEHADEPGRALVRAFTAEVHRRDKAALSGRGLGIVITTLAAAPASGWKGHGCSLKPLAAPDGTRLLHALLQPTAAPGPLVRRALAAAGGSPLRIRQIAHALREEWADAGSIPVDAPIPKWEPGLSESADGIRAAADPVGKRILEALRVAGRPLNAGEIAAAAELDPRILRPELRLLERAELVAASRHGSRQVYHLLASRSAPSRVSSRRRREAREIHRRLACHLADLPRPDLETQAHIARHTFAGGDRMPGRTLALSAARALRSASFLDAALRLLEDIDSPAFGLGERLELAEEISSIHEETGAHSAGILRLEPFHRGIHGRLSARDAVRIRRRLGVHLHRSGRPEEALQVFEEAQRLGKPARDLEDLVFIDSEIAELCTLRGAHEKAEEACRRGLARLESGQAGDEGFRLRMEVVLRGSLGHLELRRGRLPGARVELRRAAGLARRHASKAVRAVILNNLGIAENQLNRFKAAARCFREAERLLGAGGERRAVMSIACNLAVIAAKQGRPDEAHAQMERARAMLRSYPGGRHEFFVACTQGLVHQLLGESTGAVECFETALPGGRKVGDVHLTAFGEVSLAEAHIFCGRYAKALDLLRTPASGGRRAGGQGALLERMAHARLALVQALLGRDRLARRSLKVLDAGPRSSFELLEAWNALFAGAARIALGEEDAGKLDAARRIFHRLGVPAGDRLCLLARALEKIGLGELLAAAPLLRELDGAAPLGHRLVDALGPLVLAEGALARGAAQEARRFGTEASGAMVGCGFLELDAWLERLKARLDHSAGDLTAARGHLQRGLDTRDLIAELAPRAARKSLTGHLRFHGLASLTTSLERSPRLLGSTRKTGGLSAFEGIVGRSSSMQALFRQIELLRDQELPVLIRGETGTGKDLVAGALYRTSPRGRGPFLALHCATLPEEIFESELFGYEAGAFSGAERANPGILEGLEGGTLFLDGVADLSAGAQAKLLRAIESGAVRRLGGLEPRRVDVRFLSSSTADLRAGAEGGSFRNDLYYRLCAVELVLPPLRARREDVEPLTRHLLEKHARRLDRPVPEISDDALRALAEHDWPGNVRELEVVLLRACLGARSPEGTERIEAAHVEPFLAPRRPEPLFREAAFTGRTLDGLKLELERAYLAHLFRNARGDLRQMREALGVGQSQLYAWLRKLGLDVRSLRKEL